MNTWEERMAEKAKRRAPVERGFEVLDWQDGINADPDSTLRVFTFDRTFFDDDGPTFSSGYTVVDLPESGLSYKHLYPRTDPDETPEEGQP